MRYSQLARTTRATIALGRAFPSHLQATRSYATGSGGGSSHLFRNGLLASGFISAAAATYLYPEMFGGGENDDARDELKHKLETFTTRIMTRRGVVEHTHDYLGDKQAEKLLKLHETTRTFTPIKSTGVVRFDNNWVECNDPIEDRHAESFLSRDVLYTKVPKEDVQDETSIVDLVDRGGLKLFSIMDGHAGYATAELLRKTLHPMIVLSLRSLYAGYKPTTVDPLSAMRESEKGIRSFNNVKSYLWSFLPGYASSAATSSPASPFPIDHQSISDALTSAFLELDFQICHAPIRIIPHLPAKPGKPNPRPILKPMIEPADNGACAVTLLVDEDREEIYVANAGDARAVAGYWVGPHTDATGKQVTGGWRCEVLTEDQMGDNPREIERMKKEHPGEEDTVISRGRVMGALQPTRSFGDAPWYKWTEKETRAIEKLNGGETRNKPRMFDGSKTNSQPYVTARPEVIYKSLAGDAIQGQLKFIVMATDGLWDNITSEEAVGLVATHLAHPKHSPISRSAVQSSLLPELRESRDKYPGPRPKEEALGGEWVYQDENAATHLIRNSLGTGKRTVYEMLSMKAPIARWLRDDVTCSVIFFGNDTSTSIPAAIKAKL
ncbi:hypothetical protein QFC21_002530 [Naganishia friedmannii]|uniref:Uncharacterized protein n=1 Tax=Naganishia friedmannii TaxID=89922 RepID=A0ACC2VV89_9TREE|nr:hypothetical protein QFC21_002530 [Naganishia friedmannii]